MSTRASADEREETLDLNKLLIEAAQQNNAEMASAMLNAGAKRTHVDVDGNTALRYACRANYLDIAKLLVAEGFDVMACTDDGASLLHTACGYGHLPIAIWLLTDHADGMMETFLRSEDASGATLLHLSCRRTSQFPLLALILTLVMRQEADADRAPSALTVVPAEAWGYDDDGIPTYDPFGADERKRQALEREFAGSNLSFLNQLDNNGWSALHVACLTGCQHSAEWLILHGANYSRRSGPVNHCALDLAPRPLQPPLHKLAKVASRAQRHARESRFLVAALLERFVRARSPARRSGTITIADVVRFSTSVDVTVPYADTVDIDWSRVVERVVQLAAPKDVRYELEPILTRTCGGLLRKTRAMMVRFEREWIVADRENRRKELVAHRHEKAKREQERALEAAKDAKEARLAKRAARSVRPTSGRSVSRGASALSGAGRVSRSSGRPRSGGSRPNSKGSLRPGSRDSTSLPPLRPGSSQYAQDGKAGPQTGGSERGSLRPGIDGLLPSLDPGGASSGVDGAGDLNLDIVDEHGVIDQMLLSAKQKADLEQLRGNIMNWRATWLKSGRVPQSMKTECARYSIPVDFARKCLEDKTFRRQIKFRRKQ